MNNLLFESFQIKNGSLTAKDGHRYNIAYIDPATSDNTFPVNNIIKKHKGVFHKAMKAWYWPLGKNAEYIYNTFVIPCINELNGGEVIQNLDALIKETSGNVSAVNIPNLKNLLDELIRFKADLMNCMSSKEFVERMKPIIEYQQAQGHNYSLRNAILVIIQDPQATMVKSKTTWFKHMNREVVDTSHPIVLWRPDEEKYTKEEQDDIKRNFLNNIGARSVKELNAGQKEELDIQLRGKIKTDENGIPKYKKYYAYDIRFTKQIEGKPVVVGNKPKKEFDWYDKSKEQFDYVAVLVNAATKMIESSGVKIEYVPLASMGGALGVSTSGTIKLSDEPEYTQNYLDTIIHEFSHELLHQKYLKKSGNEEWARYFIGKEQGRQMVEQQAELSAWIVTSHYNLGREESLNYVGSWGMDAKTCAKVFDSVAECASFIIKKLATFEDAANAEVNNNGQNTEE